MSNILDPQRVMQSLEDGTVEAIEEFFPHVGRKNTLVAKRIYTGPKVNSNDINAQKTARMRGRTWSQPVFGDFELVDNETGKVVASVNKMKVLNLPKITRRYSYIVEGTEYQVDNQWRLKSGAYARRKANGELETQFNLSEGRGFRLGFDPAKRGFLLRYGTSNIQLLPVLQALGVSDDEIEQTLGKEVYARAVSQKKRGELVKMSKALDRRAVVNSDTEAAGVINESLSKTKISEDTTKITLGEGFGTVNGATLLSAAKKLLMINRGDAEVDNRDSLRFKELWTIDNHIPERIKNSKRRISYKIGNNVDRKEDVRSILTSDVFNIPVKTFFTSTSLSQQSSQTNPVDMLGGFMRTTIMGQGGIQSENAITDDAKLIDSSYLGIIDPVHTPEGKRSGVSAHLALGVSKVGKTPYLELRDAKTGKSVKKSPAELSGKAIAFADQYDLSGKIPKALKDSVTVVARDGGDPETVSKDSVDFVLQSPKQLFSITANLIPFLPSDQANRAGMATRHMEQAISLKNREQPLVQVVSGNPDERYKTWEGIVGGYSAHNSPVSGVVESVSASKIVVKDKSGEKHNIGMYDNFPLNEKKSFISSSPLVKKGDTVKKGQTIADTNYTKDGVLANGLNLRVGYIPYKGLVFEDGIVISEGASHRLTSEHLHKKRSYVEKNMKIGLKKYRANYPGAITDENAKKLDEDGVIKKGMKVAPGDTLMTVLQKTEPSKEQLLLKGIHKSLVRPWKDKSVVWNKPYTGTVTDVVRNGREIVVNVKTEEKADVGDKLTGRHGNKGVITAVIPNEEMPRDAEGNPLELILNPSGVPGRINLGQVLETSLAKVAEKTGGPYAVENFQRDDEKKVVKVKEHYRTIQTKEGPKRVKVKSHDRELGYQEMVKAELEKHGIDETTELFDPETGKSLGRVLVGKQYTLKLMHQIDKKLSSRAHGYGFDYDANLVPKGGGETGGAQKFGELGLYAMLAHGAVGNIRDALTWKSDKQQDEVWTAVQTGAILPSPKPSFAYEKFLAYMSALGMNVEKEGNGLIVGPMTDKQIHEMSNGELKDGSRVIRGKDLKPEKGGLFDEDVTGGPGGKNWSHIGLSEPMPNPIFEKGIRSLLGITGKEFDSVIAGESGINANGDVVEVSDSVQGGPASIVAALGAINIDGELAAAKEKIKTVRKNELDKVNKKIKYLLMLKKNGISAQEAYTLGSLPVIPPIFRPITAMEGGDLNIDGLNLLYRDIAILNNKLKESKGILPEESLRKLRDDLYNASDALYGTTTGAQAGGTTIDGTARPPGILNILSGRNSPKQSFFHTRVLDRKQDISMRSVIVPDLDLHLDELGLPRKGAMRVFRPFVVKELVNMGYSPLQAREEIEKNTSVANRALEVAADKRPVLFKRDPVLHKFGIMAFKARIHDEQSIHIHPLVTGGFNADFDGDAMAVFVPISQQAVDEAYGMLPSRNLFNPATGRVMYQPSLEGQLGLFLMTQMGKKSKNLYKNQKEVLADAKEGKISASDVVSIGDMKTTAGRILFNNTLPKKIRNDDILTNPDLVMGKKNLQATLRRVATEAPGEFAQTADRIKDLGFGHAYNIGFSFSLKDFDTLKDLRDAEMAKARVKEAAIHKKRKMKLISRAAADQQIVDLYTGVTDKLGKESKKILDKSGNKLRAMNNAGVKPAWSQLQQMLIGPMLLENANGRVIPVPVDRSYSEGLRSSDYWVASSGARKGLIEKVQSVSVPGALNKQIANTMIGYIVTTEDCGTSSGIALDSTDKDLVDRFTAKPIKIGKSTVPANTAVTPNLLSKMKTGKVSKVLVRSPLKCEAKKGMCSKCYGVADDGKALEKGVNIGLIAGTSLGERGTQLSMKTFHTGGVAGSSGGVVDGIGRISQLLKMPAILPNAATLAPISGEVTSVKESPVGGFDINIGNNEVYVPSGRTLNIAKGDRVKKGQKISSGTINPHDLLGKTNIDTVRAYLTGEIHKVYANEGIKKRNIEVVTKAMTNLGVIEDPGDSNFIRGDMVPLTRASALNRNLKNPIKINPVLRGVETLPLDQTTDWIARLQYRRLKETYIRAANEGWKSDIHGVHPAPGIAYSAEFGKPGKGEGPY